MPKDSPIADVVMHPARLRIIQQLGGRELTTTQLREALPEITQATLYRHVAALLDAGILAVVAERRVRGTTERTLALGERLAIADLDEIRAMDAAQLRTSFLTFLGLVGETFDNFLAAEDQELRDYLGFGMGQLYVADGDLPALQNQLNEVLAPYRQERPNTRRVALATILIPEAD
ncbi:DNA-binding transcriptional ArsR family regulator [Kribbella aluminosa]|uniref:DNA-binding transcriptional ArsR family regulator n=1 Tax=Kribbella aluminosa TaxID=416017 RepID=A0ABS4V139_9ACTN|nr:helix-turn-helix domain-containing protein [Kribbella aluminosa]MBP2357506.1 DNA-binding transcriptional ArsR family regulator [Kribbella aluminosa]